MRAVVLAGAGDHERAEAELAAARHLAEQTASFQQLKLVAEACATCKSRDAADAWRRVLEHSSASVADQAVARLGLSGALKNDGNHGEAARVQAEAVADLEAILGPDHASTRSAQRALADSLERLGREEEAAELRARVLASARAMLGPENSIVISDEGALATALYRLGRYTDARPLEEHVLAARRAGADAGDSSWLRLAAGNLAATLEQLEDFADAALLREELVQYARQDYGADSVAVADAEAALAITLNRLGRHDECRTLEEHVLAVRRGELGDEHPQTNLARRNLAVTLSNLNEDERSAALWTEVTSWFRLHRDLNEHPDVIAAEAQLALSLFRLGRYTESRPLGEHVCPRAGQSSEMPTR
jgi:tetratricopeptide (TPR) repeat protein